MDKQGKVPIEVENVSDAEREWLSLCYSLFRGPVKFDGPVRTPEGGRDDLYGVIREVQAILS